MNNSSHNPTPWRADSWRSKTTAQQVVYADNTAVAAVTHELQRLPPLVTHLEIEALKRQLAEAAAGQRFLLQGGDCAESFSECHASAISNKLKILLQMSLILLQGLGKPIIRVGRMAGQYAKPRSSDFETQGEITLPTYRGDLINKPDFNAADRKADPQRMLRGYHYSALTLNYIRALVDGGFANLLQPEYWELDFFQHSPMALEYKAMVQAISASLDFLQTIDGLQTSQLQQVDFYSSHEALHLIYEEALTRQVAPDRWYNLSTHFPWLGMRTAAIAGGHIEYMRGIRNPLAVKISPEIKKAHLIELIDILNPEDEPGRLTLIHRLGADKVSSLLPELIKTVQKTGRKVLWICDPMHGNTSITRDGIKTRRFDAILAELQSSFAIHKTMKNYLGGVHFELTGDNVTECTGGARNLSEHDLKYHYKSLVDPRLNYEQALEMAMLIVKMQKSL